MLDIEVRMESVSSASVLLVLDLLELCGTSVPLAPPTKTVGGFCPLGTSSSEAQPVRASRSIQTPYSIQRDLVSPVP